MPEPHKIYFIPEKYTGENYRFAYHNLIIGLWDWQYLKLFLKEKTNLNEMLFMRLEPFQLLFCLGIFPKKMKVSGILFQPWCRIPNRAVFHREFWKKLRRKLLLNWVVRKANLNKIFLLEDPKSVDFLNEKYQKNRFTYLPDPIDRNLSFHPDFDVRKHYKIDQNRKIFLCFGLIRPRKNIENILLALAELKPENAEKTTLLILGTCGKKYENQLREKVENVLSENPKLQIVLDNIFHPHDVANNIFRDSDAVLIPYIDFYYASGVLGRAALAGKPVLGSTNSLIGELIEEFELGICANPLNINDLKWGILKLISIKDQDKSHFVNFRTAENFGRTLIEAFF